MKRLIIGVSLGVAMVVCVSVAQAAITVVTELLPVPASPVTGSWYQSDVRTGGTAGIVNLAGLGGNLETGQPLPTGAAKLTTDMTDAAKAEVATFADFGLASTVLSDAVLGYSYYKQSVIGGNASAAPSMKLTIYAAGGTGDNYGSLVFEPYWNNGGNMTLPTDAWQSVSINNTTGADGNNDYGGWWWNGGFEIASSSGGPPMRSLSEWLAAFQASDSTDFANAHIVALNMGVGSYNQGQVGYFDNVSIKSAAGNLDVTYDFQAVPEPATIIVWSVLGAGSWLGMRVWRGNGRGRARWSPENRQAIHDIIARGAPR